MRLFDGRTLIVRIRNGGCDTIPRSSMLKAKISCILLHELKQKYVRVFHRFWQPRKLHVQFITGKRQSIAKFSCPSSSSWSSSGTLINVSGRNWTELFQKERRRDNIFLRICWNSSRVVTCREFHRSRRQSVKESSTTNVRTHRAGSSWWSEEASTPLGFHDESILFSKYSPNFCSRECVFFTLTPYNNPPYTRPRRKTESKASFFERRKFYENSYSTLSSIKR